MTAKMVFPPNAVVSELSDILSLSEDERVAFYGSLFAIAAIDGDMKREELDLLFETIEMTGLSDHGQRTVWDYMVEPPPLSDCLEILSTCNTEVRRTVMVYLIEMALVDDILDVREEEALLQARRALCLTQRQMRAIERFICEEGLTRLYPRDHTAFMASPKHWAFVVTALTIPATAYYFLSLTHRLNASEATLNAAIYAVMFGISFGVGVILLLGTATYLLDRLLSRRQRRRKAALDQERRRRAQVVVHNLENAIAYLNARANIDLVKPADLSDLEIPAVFAERLSMLQQMLAQRRSTAGTAS
ncbi:MAG TPA: hypothetical protein VNP04_20190 [Alphaproteobacteria bacterium]|nr:hypothetical protein [Alphaproteobacteria bacterium]